jgi:hypothetical protein
MSSDRTPFWRLLLSVIGSIKVIEGVTAIINSGA